MKVILLAAGFGTRLRPLTDSIPKCLVPIKGVPLLQIWLDRLYEAGMGPFLVNTHYMSAKVADFIQATSYGNMVTIVEEKKLLGTAGTLIANLDFFEEEGMLVHADNYCLADFSEFVQAHKARPRECLLTMMTFRADNPESCGIVEIDQRNIVVGFHEKIANPPGNLANGAVYILSAELLATMRTRFSAVTDFSTEVLKHLVGKIYTYETKKRFLDIGTPETYAAANC